MIEELNKILDVKLDFDLSNYNTYKLESTAKVFLSIKNTEELKKVIDVLDKLIRMDIVCKTNPINDSSNKKKFHFNGNITEAKDSMIYMENFILNVNVKIVSNI